MADITGTRVGDLIGYQTRDERHIGPNTRIEVVTEGILTRRLQRDPELPGVGAIVFDEVHERNLPTDIGLALTLDVANSIRPDLRILAMSATPDTEGLVRVLDAPVVASEGRTFEIEMNWIGTAARAKAQAPRGGGRKGRAPQRSNNDRIEPQVAAAVLRALGEHDGDVLAFLPGIGEIRRVQGLLRESLGPGVAVHALAGALSQADQDAALDPSPPGQRRVVLSTDIAETSLTVAGVKIVVDAGLAREPRFDPGTGMTRLTTVATSRASAEQRAGRAGRTEPGAAYRLWSRLEHGTRAKHRTPEILQADLAGFALELASWGIGDDPDRPTGDLVFIDEPPRAALRQARELLTDLRALDASGTLTTLGREMLGLPVHPRLARMVAIDKSPLSCVIASLVDERDIFRGRPDELPVDLALRVAVISGAAGHDRADRGAVHRLRDRSEELARRVGISFDRHRIDHDRCGELLLLAFPDRLAGRRRPGQFTMRNGSGAFISESDPLADEPFVVAADLDGKRDRARIRLAAAVDADVVVAEAGDDVKEQKTLSWNTDRDELVETVERRLGAIRLGHVTRRPAAGDDTTAALMKRVRETGLAVLGWSRAATQLRQRVDFLHRQEGEPWPDWSVEALVETVDDWLAPYLPGATGRADLDRLDVAMVLRSQLPWPAGAELDTIAPATLELPTGRSVPVDYSGEQPTASVRVQDLFGVTEHPVAGTTPIRLELLSPANRPIQVTADLPGFWAGSWAEVKKDMAGRYPKHRWPDDPASAAPKRMKDR
jgi:ATP-dependent helicase HrpB